MRIEFAANTEPTLGIELELSLVDRETGELTSAATPILREIGAAHGGEHPKAKHELFEATVEVITGVCRNPAEARADLEATIAEVRAAADRRAVDLISAGTHPFSSWRDQIVSPIQRYHELVAELQWTARRLAIFGVHFHVAVRSGEQAVAIVNELRGSLPLFLALSASSPYWEREDSGLASSRIKIFESLPTAGLSPRLEDWNEFEELMDTLIAARCIRSIQEIWWDVRPHPTFGTVELRMCDAPHTLGETTAIAALAQALVESLARRHEAGDFPEPRSEWTVRENKWLAARHGLDAELIVDRSGRRRPARDSIRELVAEVEPVADELGSRAELALVESILERGTGSERQRRARASGADPRALVRLLVDELATDRPVEP